MDIGGCTHPFKFLELAIFWHLSLGYFHIHVNDTRYAFVFRDWSFSLEIMSEIHPCVVCISNSFLFIASRILLCKYTTVCVATFLWMDIWAVSSVWILWLNLRYTFLSFLWAYVGVELLGHRNYPGVLLSDGKFLYSWAVYERFRRSIWDSCSSISNPIHVVACNRIFLRLNHTLLCVYTTFCLSTRLSMDICVPCTSSPLQRTLQ